MGRAKELISLAGKAWFAVMIGTAAAAVGAYQMISGSHRSAWFWLFLGAVGFVIAAVWVAWRALGLRDKAVRARAEATSTPAKPPAIANEEGGRSYSRGSRFMSGRGIKNTGEDSSSTDEDSEFT